MVGITRSLARAKPAQRLATQIKLANTEMSRLVDAYQAGAIELAELPKRRRSVEVELNTLNREKELLEKMALEQRQEGDVRGDFEEFAALIANRLQQFSFEDKQRLLRMVLDKVVVKDWRVDVHYTIPLPRPPSRRSRKCQPISIYVAHVWNLGHVFRHTQNALMAILLLWTLAFNLLQLFIYRRLGRSRRPKDPPIRSGISSKSCLANWPLFPSLFLGGLSWSTAADAAPDPHQLGGADAPAPNQFASSAWQRRPAHPKENDLLC
jgi:hypothetical protein